MCHCERSEAISRDCHVASLPAMTTFQGRSLLLFLLEGLTEHLGGLFNDFGTLFHPS